MLNSQTMLRRLKSKKAWQRLISRDMQDDWRFRDRRDWRWDDSMHEIVLDHLRLNVVRKLMWAFKKPNAKLIRHVDEIGVTVSNTPCTLRLSSNVTVSKYHGSDPPTFDLAVMLGEQHLESLVQGTAFAESEVVILAESPLTTAMQVHLLKLEIYLNSQAA